MKMDSLYLPLKSTLEELSRRHSWFDLKTPKGSLGSHEILWVFKRIHAVKPTILFESGVGTGRSTLIFCELMKPFGKVVSANFRYEGDNPLQDFKHPENLLMVDAPGEIVAASLPNQEKIVAVIDGPKPSGVLYGRPGWLQLMDELVDKKRLDSVFQHDTEDKKNMEKLRGYYHSNLEGEFILDTVTEAFLRANQFFGMEQKERIFTPNMSAILRLRSVSIPTML